MVGLIDDGDPGPLRPRNLTQARENPKPATAAQAFIGRYCASPGMAQGYPIAG
jgi:hypothetical protein